MRTSITLAAAALVLASGPVLAQNAPSGSYPSTTYRGMTEEAIKYQGPPPPNTYVGMATTELYQGALPQSLVGKRVYTQRNDAVGTIVSVRDETMLVSAGEYLGMGERVVALPREWATFSGSGNNLLVVTLASKAQLNSLPSYQGAR